MSWRPGGARRIIALAAAASITTAAAHRAAADPETEPATEEDAGWTPGKIWSSASLGGIYAGVTVWAYFAWYHDKPKNLHFKVNGDGLFGVNTYAGGSDKLGHFYSNHLISRATSELLIAGGWRPLPASLIAGGLCAAFFGFVEVKDGYYYEFSTGDFVADVGGAALSTLLINRPDIDRLFDFRLDYWPTSEYMDGFGDGDVNFAEDYSGQTYLLALHLGALPRLADSRWTAWTRYVDLVGGFQSLNYKPEPSDPEAVESQHLFLGAALNLQGVLDAVYGGPAERGRASIGHQVGHFVFEFVSPPYTTLRLAEGARSPDGP